MKRIVAMVLCICIIFTGCARNGKKANEDTGTKSNSGVSGNDAENGDISNEDGKEADAEKTPLLQLSKEWSSVKSAGKTNPLLTIPEYEAKVTPYTVAGDLSNIENINQFTGFTKEQKKMLSENGFVVLPSYDTKMHYIYDSNEYGGIPNFITTDSVLHTYHQFYDKSLMAVETNFLYKDLELMTKQMLTKSILLLGALKEEDLITLQKSNVIYYLVANMLMSKSSDITAEVDADLMVVAKAEYNLIEKAEMIEISPLLGVKLDYSQFKIRGHYTRSEELGRFFRTMIWYGIVPYQLVNPAKEFQYENTLQALLMTFTTFLESESTPDAKLWSDIYFPTAQYVGISDDIDVFTMNSLRLEVFGEGNDPNIYNDETYYDKLEKAVKALPEPKIQGDFLTTTPTGKQFRFMGQRYILDSFIMQNLTDSILRPIPSALDTMGVMGSNVAEQLLFNVYKPQELWPEYEEKYAKLKEEVSGYKSEVWENNLYSGWLWSIKEELTEFDANSGMPFFMVTDAWKYKSLNAALGSYTELKHDTVLYGKQSVAEMGGPEAFANQHYVEPNIPLYSKLLYLTDYTISVLTERGMMNEGLLSGSNEYKALLGLLIECSIKELRNEPLTAEERKQLLWYGGKLENISYSYQMGLTGSIADIQVSDMLVTDVASYMNTYLSLGTGYFDHIYVVVPVDGKLYLTRGSVYSHYEFVSDTRLTDEEWWKLQGINVTHEDYGDSMEMVEPTDALPAQPTWVQNFKSEDNKVVTIPLDTDWEKLNE